ncbi:hypothetical protein ABTX35_29310 [Streptomyces sp. NPDC096080]|uniref:hypothetical protein n=1 Tax=Streptomyces sp. NPDC096080 TaxID=3156693 RepID=UPI003327FE30
MGASGLSNETGTEGADTGRAPAPPELLKDDVPGAHRRVSDLYTEGYLNVIAVAVALALALAVPVLQYYSLVLLAVPRRILRFRDRAAAR